MGIEFKKNDKLTKIITAILVGILLLVVFIPVNKNNGMSSTTAETMNIADCTDFEMYSEYYEARLTEILEDSYGEGTMNVMVRISAYNNQDTTYISYNDNNEVTVDGVLIVADVKMITASTPSTAPRIRSSTIINDFTKKINEGRSNIPPSTLMCLVILVHILVCL